MKKFITLSVISTAFLASITANAYPIITTNSGDSGVYLQLTGGINYLQNQYIYNTNNSNGANTKYKIGWDGGLGLGYKQQNWRLALTVDYLRNGVDNISIANLKGGTQTVTGDYHAAITYLANAYHDFDLGSRWIPYIGLGGGLATLMAKNIDGTNNNSKEHDNVFAYQNTLGLGYQVNDNWRLFFEYHHIATTNASFAIANGNIKTYYQNNLGNIGVSYTFS